MDRTREFTFNLSIPDLLKKQAEKKTDAIAIAAIGRTPLTYRRLNIHINDIVTALNAIGIDRHDRVAIVLPNGPEMAVAFLAVASTATCATLNPAYRAAEFDFYLSDLNAKVLIIQSGIAEAAKTVAQELGIPIIELSPDLEAEAGIFTLNYQNFPQNPTSNIQHPTSDDVALVLHTSGTTSRPKMVPLTHKNLCTSAHNISQTLNLVESDRCLNVMPLFHIHGLIGALLSSLNVGASIVCTPGFDTTKFFAWVAETRPTWYSAVPTMHQAILAVSQAKIDIIASCPLRLIRSSSASLSPQVMVELENTFNVPVIEAYGMTEASHQMASNPLPPQVRKPGSVGVAAGPEIAIMDEAGNLLPPQEVGEVVIRGVNVTLGYENNPEANKNAFTNGWFRTGDLGYLDIDNYLFLKGRIKEIINRGGEKISPREIDEVLLDHPAIAQVVAFAVPHPLLGENVAATVVLKPEYTATEQEIKEFAATRLADFKVPSIIVFVDEIPKGPTGKLQRIGLAEKLGLTSQESTITKREYTPPRTNLEENLAKIWSEVLGIEEVGIHDNFFSLGGHSLLAVQLIEQIQKIIDVDLPVATLIQASTVAELASIISRPKSTSKFWATLVQIKRNGSQPPFFFHAGGTGAISWTQFGRRLPIDRPFYVLQHPALVGKSMSETSIEQMAADCVEEIRAIQPNGPYFIGGHCTGGIIAFEMAYQLRDRGEKVALLALVDANAPIALPKEDILWQIEAFFYQLSFLVYEAYYSSINKVISYYEYYNYYHVDKLRELGLIGKVTYIGDRLFDQVKLKLKLNKVLPDKLLKTKIGKHENNHEINMPKSSEFVPHLLRYQEAANINQAAKDKYVPRLYGGKITLFRASIQKLEWYLGPTLGWSELAADEVESYKIPGLADRLFEPLSVSLLVEKVKVSLDEAQAEQTNSMSL